MHDDACVQFLQWALPQLHMRWPGFRKVRAQVCKRLQRRLYNLHLTDVEAYRDYLEQHVDEWGVLDSLVRVTISRFYRDKMMFAFLGQQVLPDLATQAIESGDKSLNILSVGCASGEEPYTLAIIWQLQLQQRFPDLNLHIVAIDADSAMCQRAEQARYQYSSIKNLPAAWREQVFVKEGDNYQLKSEFRKDCLFKVEDVRNTIPSGKFHMVLCRNLVFTYYDETLQHDTLERIKAVIYQGGALVTGIHECLPQDVAGFTPWHEKFRIYRKTG